jgi:hypothetical protein
MSPDDHFMYFRESHSLKLLHVKASDHFWNGLLRQPCSLLSLNLVSKVGLKLQVSRLNSAYWLIRYVIKNLTLLIIGWSYSLFVSDNRYIPISALVPICQTAWCHIRKLHYLWQPQISHFMFAGMFDQRCLEHSEEMKSNTQLSPKNSKMLNKVKTFGEIFFV